MALAGIESVTMFTLVELPPENDHPKKFVGESDTSAKLTLHREELSNLKVCRKFAAVPTEKMTSSRRAFVRITLEREGSSNTIEP